MRKCPRCGYEIKEDEKFCPHCGLDIQQRYGSKGPKNKSMTYLLYVIIFFSFVTIPLLYSRILGDIGNNLTSTNEGERIKLEDVMDATPTTIMGQFTTLADYNKQFTNVSGYIENIEKYETELSAKGNYVFDKEYKIQVLDNYNVYYNLKYSVAISDNLTLNIERTFDRSHTFNKETVTVKKNNVTTFQDFILNEDELKIVYTFVDDQTLVDKLITQFSKRESEFEEKKEKLGHYGLGNYEGKSSFVAHRKGSTYYSELTYAHDAKEYID
ncbi:MAG: zinc ribbon domain-containing protein [Coprobacillus sp.]